MPRPIPSYEKKQRGCKYCNDVQMIAFSKETRTVCPFDECPYAVLDKYNTYEEFMESEDSKILVNEFFSTVAVVYNFSMPRTPKKLYSEGNSRVNL
jgi:hypothetical protein